ncbi:MAG: Lrp/AsnC family transcriptional regulator [Candidatus Neomarinimicrobiota bacterium]|nr:MAG: Lrp/AsnC family transcriptional regulator [Candidatus Neomarinimicrobiota bacterium]
MFHMDKIDKNILEMLQNNGRMTAGALANELGISRTAAYERIKKLERRRIIRKVVALIDPARVGLTCFTFVEVQLERHGREAVQRFLHAITSIQEVMECHHITGEADFLLKVATKDTGSYEDLLLNQLTALPDVRNLKTLVVLSTIKQETAYTIP